MEGAGCGGHLWYRPMVFPSIIVVIPVTPGISVKYPIFWSPDYALVGIGAYKPRWFMQPNHISPYDALTASTDMKAALTIPMHYGTFDLSDEPLHDPPLVFLLPKPRSER